MPDPKNQLLSVPDKLITFIPETGSLTINASNITLEDIKQIVREEIEAALNRWELRQEHQLLQQKFDSRLK